MFKAPIKVLHPLLTATQEGNYKGTEGLRRDSRSTA
jgi:serine protein kinase